MPAVEPTLTWSKAKQIQWVFSAEQNDTKEEFYKNSATHNDVFCLMLNV